MAGARPSRGARVVYREIDSDDSDYEYDDFTKVVLVDNLGDDDDSNDVDFCPTNSGGQEVVPTVSKISWDPGRWRATIFSAGCVPRTQSSPETAKESLPAGRQISSQILPQ